MSLPHEGVEVGNQGIAQLDGIPDIAGACAVHPRLGHGVVVTGRMDGKPRLEDAVLYPAHQKLFVGAGPKSGNVGAAVGNPESPRPSKVAMLYLSCHSWCSCRPTTPGVALNAAAA